MSKVLSKTERKQFQKNAKTLTTWLENERTELKIALKNLIKNHVSSLKSKDDFYEYAILTGEYEVNNLVVITNCESDIKENSTYYRYCVDEWANWDHDALSKINPLIEDLNIRFESMHSKLNSKRANDFQLDYLQIKHIDLFHNAILFALRELVEEKIFETTKVEPFVAIWISDSDHEIIGQSVYDLNSFKISDRFFEEFDLS